MAETRQQGQGKATSAGTREVEGADKAAELSPEDQQAIRQSDRGDTAARADAPDTSGKRLRGVFYGGGTTIELRKADFAANGIDHGPVKFDFRKDSGTIAVGDGKNNTITQEAADFLVKNHSHQFEWLNQGDDE